ncbi:D-alanyl-D-alanine carboxypeptidase/D-alanyl-D-alanine-endopeptidase [Bacillus dakarensis]|uniref:D-alanyl-D-alanine carboxypeptidase/D-alanyl-D-alanine endopeptidase n=1 Tax=Robertmurraya dakarensis TaxID=1926278 RepID=UPI000980F064|nr:D-alanyl-D-alanine carboxypeptidase/D-alanyl-D-alanine-endopeptidase [Bacillus dakarensis]
MKKNNLQKAIHKGGFILLLSILLFIPPIKAKAPQALAAEQGQTMEKQLLQLLQDEPSLKGAIAGISIRSAKTGDLRFEYNGDIRLRPASNMKLLTAAVSLAVLGKNYKFTTDVLTDGAIDEHTLKGNLYLRGKGDPTLLKEDFDEMAMKIKKSGIHVIEGNLIGDDSWYDEVRLSPDLIWSDEYVYYGSQISALTASPTKDFDSGTVQITVTPGKAIGDGAIVQIEPKTDYVKIVNHAVTGSPDSNSEIHFNRKHGENIVTVEGIIPIHASEEKEWIAVWEPSLYALNVFKQSLAEKGVEVKEDVKIGQTPSQAAVITSHQSIPLSDLLVPFMKLSNNSHAEILIKEMGRMVKGEGSWEKGLEVVREQVPQLGINPNTIVIRDGSGISHVNLIPANEISNLLYHVQKESWFPAFMNSLPVAGSDEKMIGGTLRNRMASASMSGNIKAKTGTITTVTSLSGYVKTKSEELLIFSILLNNLVDEEKGKDIEDKIVTILANQ